MASIVIEMVIEVVGVDELTRERMQRRDNRPGSKPWEAPVFKGLAEKKGSVKRRLRRRGLSGGSNGEGVVRSDKIK